MRIVALITKSKLDYHKKLLADGAEGTMLKDIRAAYVQEGRPKSMYKLKRREEVDAFITGGEPGDEGKGWELLIGKLDFSCYTEVNKIHMVARCSNLHLDQRIDVSVCKYCKSRLDVKHENIDGKRIIQGTTCTNLQCAKVNGGATVNPKWLGKVAEVTGQEWTARVFRLKHANIERWRDTGEDKKSPEECRIKLTVIQRRFIRQSIDMESL